LNFGFELVMRLCPLSVASQEVFEAAARAA